MKKFAIGLLLAVAAATPALAEVKSGATLFDVDGHRLGKIDRVLEDGTVRTIVGTKMVRIPGSTVKDVDGKATTTMTKAQVRKL
jgi:hypothetical protein